MGKKKVGGRAKASRKRNVFRRNEHQKTGFWDNFSFSNNLLVLWTTAILIRNLGEKIEKGIFRLFWSFFVSKNFTFTQIM